MAAPIIDTLETLDLVQRALKECGEGSTVHDLELYKAACSALSAVIPYIRKPKAPVQQKHYEAIHSLEEMMRK